MKSPQAKSVRLLQERHQENLETMLRNLLKDETLCDVTIHCKDGEVRAHRVILAAFSPYFKKIFENHLEASVAFVLYGVSVNEIKSLVELIYRGSTQIPLDMTGPIYDIAEEFGMKGIVDEYQSNINGRDTRFKGQKRVNVDFENDFSDYQPVNIKCPKFDSDKPIDDPPATPVVIEEPAASENNDSSNPIIPSALDSLGLLPSVKSPASPGLSSITMPMTAEARRKNNWAMKQRKYKCALCPASFKRASHLSRHQLVHTGERPYKCNQCDKAFSRHDKLKHHIRKTHTPEYIGNMLESPTDSNLYTIGHVKMESQLTDSDLIEEPTRITREDLLAQMRLNSEVESRLPTVLEEPQNLSTSEVAPVELTNIANEEKIDDNCTEGSSDSPSTAVQKKGRGRPRKYPAVTRPLVKRPRGRPRLNQSDSSSKQQSENYDITNMPFGDLEYLTKPMNIDPSSENYEESNNSLDGNVMEPLVEIELDQNSPKKAKYEGQEEEPNEVGNGEEKAEEDPVLHHGTAGAFLQNIGLLETSAVKKMELGECTVSVSNGST